MDRDLIEITDTDTHIHRVLYRWDQEETDRSLFTCRPVQELPQWDIFMESLAHRLTRGSLRIFVLWDNQAKVPLGRVTVFDYNPRNHSAEFGYYLPPGNRHHGYGKAMLQRFVSFMFSDSIWPLNKLQATTASGNIPSTRLLQGLGFHLDGVMREHYWFSSIVQDQHCYSLLEREWTKP